MNVRMKCCIKLNEIQTLSWKTKNQRNCLFALSGLLVYQAWHSCSGLFAVMSQLLVCNTLVLTMSTKSCISDSGSQAVHI